MTSAPLPTQTGSLPAGSGKAMGRFREPVAQGPGAPRRGGETAGESVGLPEGPEHGDG